MKVYEKCPNCGKKLSGLFGQSAELMDEKITRYLNKQTGENKEAYCSACYEPMYSNFFNAQKKQKHEIDLRINEIIHSLPLLTCPAPQGWDYEVLGMVNTQTTSGTGFLTDLSQGINDMLGMGSARTNSKIAQATEKCKSDLRIECASLGGNAIISTNMAFNEVGGNSANMLMVCMSGTAIKVKDMNNFTSETRENLMEITKLASELKELIKELPANA
jgi:UPF0145 protein yruck0001_19990